MADTPLITTGNMITVTDKVAAIYIGLNAAIGGAGDLLLYDTAVEVLDTIIEMGSAGGANYWAVKDLMEYAKNLRDNMAVDQVVSATCLQFIQQLNNHCNLRGSNVSANIIGVDSFATYYNGAGTFKDVVYDPDFAAVWLAQMSVALTPANVFSPNIMEGITYPNGMGKWNYNGGSPLFTDGAAVDTTKYLGGVQHLKVTSQLSGTAVMVTVAGKNHLGVAHNFTYGPFDNIAVGTYDLSDQSTMWITDVTNITVANATAGVCYVECHGPR